jgi:hypothetical protein
MAAADSVMTDDKSDGTAVADLVMTDDRRFGRMTTVTSVEELNPNLFPGGTGMVASGGGGPGFIRAASFVGHLIESGLLSHELVQQHLIKSLINHQDNDNQHHTSGAVRSTAIYELFTAAGNTLLQGLLEPDDVQVCFHKLDLRPLDYMGFNTAKLKVRCTTHNNTSR